MISFYNLPLFSKIWAYFEILYLLGIEYLFIEIYVPRSDF